MTRVSSMDGRHPNIRLGTPHKSREDRNLVIHPYGKAPNLWHACHIWMEDIQILVWAHRIIRPRMGTLYCHTSIWPSAKFMTCVSSFDGRLPNTRLGTPQNFLEYGNLVIHPYGQAPNIWLVCHLWMEDIQILFWAHLIIRARMGTL